MLDDKKQHNFFSVTKIIIVTQKVSLVLGATAIASLGAVLVVAMVIHKVRPLH